MDDTHLERAIKSVGKACFVKYFEYFKNLNYSTGDLVELLMKNEKYAETASRTRVSYSRSIIESGRSQEILIDVTKSNRLDESIIERANYLLSLYY